MHLNIKRCLHCSGIAYTCSIICLDIGSMAWKGFSDPTLQIPTEIGPLRECSLWLGHTRDFRRRRDRRLNRRQSPTKISNPATLAIKIGDYRWSCLFFYIHFWRAPHDLIKKKGTPRPNFQKVFIWVKYHMWHWNMEKRNKIQRNTFYKKVFLFL